MMDSRKLLIFTIPTAVLIAAPFPLLYPLAVAAAACCERRLPRNDARLVGLLIIVAILLGTALAQWGWIPLWGPRTPGGESTWSGWPGWSLGWVSALSVWAVVARIGCWQADAASRGSASAVAADKIRREKLAIRGRRRSASAIAAIELDSGDSRLSADQPTRVSFPTEQSSASHLTYDFDAADVLQTWLDQTSVETFRSGLQTAKLSSISPTTLLPKPGETSEELVRRLIAAGELTAYQAVLICAGLPLLLRIDEFEVLDRLGRGGMAMVLRVRHRVTGHLYALKLLEEPDPIDPVFRQRFLREMEAVCSLAHPSVAVARSVGRHDNQMHIVMELVEGQNLAQVVAEQGPLPPGRALDFAAQAARALAHAHDRGLVHRDVKPANLMLGPGNQVKLVDMGLARFVDATESRGAAREGAGLTHTGHLIGTIDYMAPEQAEELTVSDHRSDIYSLGCTLFFLLTGQSHLQGRTQRRRAMALINRRGMTELRGLRENLPECLYRLVSKMTQLDPEARYQTMDEVIAAMDQCGRELGVTSPCERHFRVLMVEDSLTQSIVTREKLMATSPNVWIQAVASLAEAIAACRRDRFDIVLLDLNLPDSMGVATVAQLRHCEAATPIIVMTSSNDPELGVACITAGADDFLPKQEIEPSMLQRHILLTIGRQRAATDSAAISPVQPHVSCETPRPATLPVDSAAAEANRPQDQNSR